MHPGNPITVLIAVEHALFREGIHVLLAEQANLEVVGEAADDLQLLCLVEALSPDVLVLDSQMLAAGGLEILATIRGLSPGTKVLLLSVRLEDDLLSDAMQQGAHGCLSTAAMHCELLRAIRALAAGEVWAPRALLARVVERLRQRVAMQQGSPSALRESLTSREYEVVQAVIRGLTNHEIATRLGISEKTVKTHMRSVFRKLHIRRRVDLLRFPLTS
jgi:DNA-binding NarL/FixJ family response regulator